MPSHNRHPLARLLTYTCIAALTAAITILTCRPDTAHPPEHIGTTSRIDTIINPTALPANILLPTTTTTTPPTSSAPTTTTAPADPPADIAGDDSTDSVHAAIARWFGDLYRQALAVANCESTLHPNARSGPNYGLFQINRVHADTWAQVTGTSFTSSWSDPNLNAQFARWLYDQQGWAPWACRWAAQH